MENNHVLLIFHYCSIRYIDILLYSRYIVICKIDPILSLFLGADETPKFHISLGVYKVTVTMQNKT
jgi:hypothetical protein